MCALGLHSSPVAYHRSNLLLPMILVRNQIRDMLGGETGKFTFGKLSINVGLGAKRIASWYNILVHWEVADFEVVVVMFMTVYVARRNSACS